MLKLAAGLFLLLLEGNALATERCPPGYSGFRSSLISEIEKLPLVSFPLEKIEAWTGGPDPAASLYYRGIDLNEFLPEARMANLHYLNDSYNKISNIGSYLKNIDQLKNGAEAQGLSFSDPNALVFYPKSGADSVLPLRLFDANVVAVDLNNFFPRKFEKGFMLRPALGGSLQHAAILQQEDGIGPRILSGILASNPAARLKSIQYFSTTKIVPAKHHWFPLFREKERSFQRRHALIRHDKGEGTAERFFLYIEDVIPHNLDGIKATWWGQLLARQAPDAAIFKGTMIHMGGQKALVEATRSWMPKGTIIEGVNLKGDDRTSFFGEFLGVQFEKPPGFYGDFEGGFGGMNPTTPFNKVHIFDLGQSP